MKRSFRAILTASAAAVAAIGAVDQALAIPVTTGDLVVFQQNTTLTTGVSIQLNEFTPSGTTVQTITDNSLFTDSAASEGYLSLSDGGTEVSYNGYTAQNATQNTVLTRAVGVLNTGSGTISYPANTTYTSTSGQNARSAYSPDGTNWYEGDQTGLFYNNGSNLFTAATSIHSLVSVGGTTYTIQGSHVFSISPGSPTPGTTLATLTSVVSESTPGSPQDISLVSSGSNGSTYDTLYVTDSTANGLIFKYADIGGTWTAEGDVSFTTTTLAAHTLEDITAEQLPNGTVDLFITADSKSHGWLYEITDTSGAYNAPIALSTSALTALAESPTGDQFTGIVFVPEPAVISLMSLMTLGLLARRRRLVAQDPDKCQDEHKSRR